MTLCDCRLNGLSPAAIDPAVLLIDVREHPPQMSRLTLPMAGREGLQLTRQQRASLSVTCELELHDPDPVRRKSLCQRVARWAAPGGWLTLSDRPGQRLRVTCDAPPVLPSALHWTQPVSVTFTAWEAPWWEDARPTAATATAPAATGSLLLRPPGDLPAPLAASFTAQGAVSALSLACGGATVALSGLAMAAGETLTIDYDDRQLLRIVIRSGAGAERSALRCRSADSPDDLWLTPRQDNKVSWQAAGPVTASVSARGRYL